MSGKIPSLDKLNIKNLTGWKPGDPLSAAKLQEPIEVLKNIGRVRPGGQVIKEPAKAIQLRMFKVIELDTDVIKCFTWDGMAKGDDEILVALPYLLRKTPFDKATRVGPDRAGISYEYSDFHLRVATNEDDDTEDQILVASYEEDDIIFAMKGIFSNTSVYHDPGADEEPVIWLDMNNDGRFWALDDDPPDEEE